MSHPVVPGSFAKLLLSFVEGHPSLALHNYTELWYDKSFATFFFLLLLFVSFVGFEDGRFLLLSVSWALLFFYPVLELSLVFC